MGLAATNLILANEFVSLKARVKAECLRRKYKGSVTKYGGTEYDYKVVPRADRLILPEHVNKLIEPLEAINSDIEYETAKEGGLIKELNIIEEFLTKIEQTKYGSTSSDCKTSCTGLCLGGCGNGCTGCSGDCQGSCEGRCKGGCSSSCATKCDGGDCDTTCTGACHTGCSYFCTGGCKDNCQGTCTYGEDKD